MTSITPTVDLLSPASFAAGQPHEMFAWLRDHDPVHRHADYYDRFRALFGLDISPDE